MPLTQSADPGTEYLLPFARRRLAQIRAQMDLAGVPSFTRAIPVLGATIYLHSAPIGHGLFKEWIRITGGNAYVFGTLPAPAGGYTDSVGTFQSLPPPWIYNSAVVQGPYQVSGNWSLTGLGTPQAMGFGSDAFSASSDVFSPANPVYWGIETYTNYLDNALPPGVKNGVFTYKTGVDGTTRTLLPALPQYAGVAGIIAIQSGIVTPAWQAYLFGINYSVTRSAGFNHTITTHFNSVGTGVDIVLTAPVVNGVSQGVFGDPTGQTQTEVLGTVSLSYTPSTQLFAFEKWKPATTSIISAMPPVDLVGKNALLNWKGIGAVSNPAGSAADVAYQTAVLAAT